MRFERNNTHLRSITFTVTVGSGKRSLLAKESRRTEFFNVWRVLRLTEVLRPNTDKDMNTRLKHLWFKLWVRNPYCLCTMCSKKLNWTLWPESASILYRPSDRRLSAKLVPIFADRRCQVVSVTDPYGRILGFLDRNNVLYSDYFKFLPFMLLLLCLVFVLSSFFSFFHSFFLQNDRLCGLVVPGYRSRGPGSIPGATKFFEK
jgi:hypothetical protein